MIEPIDRTKLMRMSEAQLIDLMELQARPAQQAMRDASLERELKELERDLAQAERERNEADVQAGLAAKQLAKAAHWDTYEQTRLKPLTNLIEWGRHGWVVSIPGGLGTLVTAAVLLGGSMGLMQLTGQNGPALLAVWAIAAVLVTVVWLALVWAAHVHAQKLNALHRLAKPEEHR